MKIYAKKHAAKILLAIGLYENYLKHNPNEEGLFRINLGEKTDSEILNAHESIKIHKQLLSTIVEIPEMNFKGRSLNTRMSNPLTS